uniref:HMG box domain-containing protein n=1 Tax=Glossina austeni TaxID=7395 RepID=A0A1A9VDE8_GLOAU
MAANKADCGVLIFDDDTKQCAPASASNCNDEIYKKSTAPTAFFVYLYEFRQTLKLGCARKLRQVDICKTAGKRWRQMSECQKQPYKLWALKNRKTKGGMMKSKTQARKPRCWTPALCYNCFNCVKKEADATRQAKIKNVWFTSLLCPAIHAIYPMEFNGNLMFLGFT